jgi:hypothetical protein
MKQDYTDHLHRIQDLSIRRNLRKKSKESQHMGTDMKAILFYGFVQADESEQSWEKAYGKLQTDPVTFFEVTQTVGFEFDTYESEKGCFYYLSPTEATFKADADASAYPYAIASARLAVQPKWEAKLRDYAHLVGVDVADQRPRWYLVCSQAI